MNNKVLINFEGRFPSGEVFDDEYAAGEPYMVVLGMGRLPFEIEKTLLNMDIGEDKTLNLPCEKAYGKYKEEAIQKIPVFAIPDGHLLPVGEFVKINSPDAPSPAFAKVLGIEQGFVELDFNHPLAGKDLVYWIRLVDIVQ